MKKDNPTGRYSFLIALSVADIVGALSFGLLTLYNGIAYTENPVTATFYQQGTLFLPPKYKMMLFGLLTAICIVIYLFLTMKRQELRDLVEYDENGVSRKKGSFSQLSKKERDAIDAQKMIDAERILPTTTLKTITRVGCDNPEKELEALVGLVEIKAKVKEMLARMEFEMGDPDERKKKRKKKEEKKTFTLSGMNMFLTGSPGTGKTTVARIMTSFLYRYGYIPKNQIIEVDGNFFNGMSKGESSKRASMLIAKAKGGVLFIDEAYALLSAGGTQEVIATIVKAMEDNKDDTIFIFAGYSNEMEELLDSNPGIKSRVKYHLTFPDYNGEEMREIFIRMANEQNLCPDVELVDKVVNELMYQKSNPNFGNARSVRTLLDKIIDKHAVNLADGRLDKNDKYRLVAVDFVSE